MKIIGAGFGRTGTLSIKYALEELGFNPCYHMRDVIAHPSHAALWEAVADGQPPQWDVLLGDYQAGVDAPVSLYYKQLMAQYPDAKVLLSVRDSERWYESVAESIYLLNDTPRWMEWLPRIGGFRRMTRKTIWEGFFQGRFEDRAFAIALFEQHNAEVIRSVPADKLLVFNVKEGWEPLCNFLNVPVPDKPFPHVNDRAEMQANIRKVQQTAIVLRIAFFMLLALLLRRFAKRLSK